MCLDIWERFFTFTSKLDKIIQVDDFRMKTRKTQWDNFLGLPPFFQESNRES